MAHSRSLSKHEHVLATATAAVRLYLAQLASSLQPKCEQICLEKLLQPVTPADMRAGEILIQEELLPSITHLGTQGS